MRAGAGLPPQRRLRLRTRTYEGRQWGAVSTGTAFLLLGVAGIATFGAIQFYSWLNPTNPCSSKVDPDSGFVHCEGQQLMLKGEPVFLRGINIYNANSEGLVEGEWDDRQCFDEFKPDGFEGDIPDGVAEVTLNEAFRELKPGTVVRAWFFQNMAPMKNGEREWDRFDRTLELAEEHGLLIIPVLANHQPDCEGWGGTKTLDWYDKGYREDPDPWGTATFKVWVGEIVKKYRGRTSIAFWQIINEAEIPKDDKGVCPEDAAKILRTFAEDVAQLIHNTDHSHLVSLGTLGTNQCPFSEDDKTDHYVDVHKAEGIDLCEIHDYATKGTVPIDSEGNRIIVSSDVYRRAEQCRDLQMPLIVGESGINPYLEGGLEARASVFASKIALMRELKIDGFLAWEFLGSDEYNIGLGDPALAALGIAADQSPATTEPPTTASPGTTTPVPGTMQCPNTFDPLYLETYLFTLAAYLNLDYQESAWFTDEQRLPEGNCDHEWQYELAGQTALGDDWDKIEHAVNTYGFGCVHEDQDAIQSWVCTREAEFLTVDLEVGGMAHILWQTPVEGAPTGTTEPAPTADCAADVSGFISQDAYEYDRQCEDLDGDGQAEIIVHAIRQTSFCGELDGGGESDLHVFAFDRDRGEWVEVYGLSHPREDLGAITEVSVVDLDGGPGKQVLWTTTAGGGCGANYWHDLLVVGWDGTTAKTLLESSFEGVTTVRAGKLVDVQFNYAQWDATSFPSSCTVRTYGWSGGGLVVDQEIGPISCNVAWDYDPTVGIVGDVVLQGDGLGVVSFGDEAEAVINTLAFFLGQPVEDTGWQFVDPFFRDPPIPECDRRVVTYPGVDLHFGLEEDNQVDLGFVGYVVATDAIRTPERLGVGALVGDFPNAASIATDGGPYAAYVSFSNMRFYGADAFYPEDLNPSVAIEAVEAGHNPCDLP